MTPYKVEAEKPAAENSSGPKAAREELLATARARFDLAVEAEAEMRKEAEEDLRFRAGDQWPEDVKATRAQDNRPCLTINRLPQFIRQVTNDQRQNRPSIKVNPFDDAADIETAKAYQGLIRHIEYNSNADVAYDTAFEGTAIKGLGYFRITTDYSDAFSFDQEIFIKRIRNSNSVYLDPHYQQPDGSDSNWGFIFEDINIEDFKIKYPDSEFCNGQSDWKSVGDELPNWCDGKTVRIAEYFYKTFEKKTICLLSNGRVVEKDKLTFPLPEGFEIKSERETVLPAIKWCKITGRDILEETEWPGQWIPIIPVLGDELDVNGRRILEGVIRHAKDPQRMYNYWASSETETIALAPRAPFIGVEGTFEGFEEQWKTANTRSHAYLQYKSKLIGGEPAPPPQRQAYEPGTQAITQARMQSSDDLKATTGIYDASLGNRSNENSGVAIQRRNAQAQTNNFHFIDNLTRAMRHAGRIIVDLIPHIYDTERAVRIIGEDGSVKVVTINKVFGEKDKQKSYLLGHGKFDVTVSTGPSYQTKRQEAVESMLGFIQAYPAAAQVIGDLLAQNMDWPGSEKIAERLKKMLPPMLQEPKEGEAPKLPPEVQQQLAQISQQNEQLTKALNEAHDQLDTKKMELESRERIEFEKIKAQIEIELAKMGSKEAQVLLGHEISALNAQQAAAAARVPNEVMEEEQFKSDQNTGAGSFGAAQPIEQQQSTGGYPPGSTVEE